MHELSITQAVVDTVVDHLGPDAEVVVVRLEIGKLSGVVVDSVRFCYDLVVEDTPLAGSRLEVDEPAGAGRCRACARRFDTDDPILLCPGCGSANVEVLAGEDLRIKSVEVRTGCARPAAAPTTAECG